ncbi:hypothetical protein PENTCL1PPCAC_26367, partial [Pristionchus entomophagus]
NFHLSHKDLCEFETCASLSMWRVALFISYLVQPLFSTVSLSPTPDRLSVDSFTTLILYDSFGDSIASDRVGRKKKSEMIR